MKLGRECETSELYASLAFFSETNYRMAIFIAEVYIAHFMKAKHYYEATTYLLQPIK